MIVEVLQEVCEVKGHGRAQTALSDDGVGCTWMGSQHARPGGLE